MSIEWRLAIGEARVFLKFRPCTGSLLKLAETAKVEVEMEMEMMIEKPKNPLSERGEKFTEFAGGSEESLL